MHTIFLPGKSSPSNGIGIIIAQRSIPLSEWPAYLRELSAQKTAGEKGLGDTVERVIGKFGSDAFRTWYAEKAGVFKSQCRCTKWKPIWNARYPYA